MSRRVQYRTITPSQARANFGITAAETTQIERTVEKAIKLAKGRVAAATRLAEQAAPPSVTRGESLKLVSEDGKIKEVIQRFGYNGQAAFIDWLNFTVQDLLFLSMDSKDCLDHGDLNIVYQQQRVIRQVSSLCHRLFGFGITRQRDRGLNFYERSYVLGDGFGFVCHGGNRETVLIQLSGEGLTAAAKNWEKRLHEFFTNNAAFCRITRIDLAHDDFLAERFSVDTFSEGYENGSFNSGGRNPDCEMRGNWKSPNGKGRSFYVGNRTNGKFFRCYEKGKQLGCPDSPWVRVEVEFKSVDRVIPFDVLLYTGEYLAAAYPALAFFQHRQERILTTQKAVQASHERLVKWLQHQCGAAINYLSQVEQSSEKVINLIKREGKLPKGLKVPSIADCGEFIHESVITPAFMPQTT